MVRSRDRHNIYYEKPTFVLFVWNHGVRDLGVTFLMGLGIAHESTYSVPPPKSDQTRFVPLQDGREQLSVSVDNRNLGPCLQLVNCEFVCTELLVLMFLFASELSHSCK